MFLGLLDRESAKDEECVSLNLDSSVINAEIFCNVLHICVYLGHPYL